jgi:SAM-dependent methyltransferase
VQAIARAKQDAGPAADYLRFHAAVTHAQLTGWLPADSRFLIDISGPGARSAEVAACAGHSVLRVIDPGTPRAPAPNSYEASGRLSTVTADSSGLEFLPDCCADGVIAENRALSLRLAAEEVAAEIARVLKPGGRLLITVPFLYPTHEAPYDFWRTTHHGLRSVLNRHGLEVDDLAAQGGPLLLVAHYAILAVVGALRALSGVLGPLRVITDNRVVSGVIAAPQELLRSRVPTKLTTLSRAASLGYMAAATKPCACSRTDSGEPTDCRREVTFTG